MQVVTTSVPCTPQVAGTSHNKALREVLPLPQPNTIKPQTSGATAPANYSPPGNYSLPANYSPPSYPAKPTPANYVAANYTAAKHTSPSYGAACAGTATATATAVAVPAQCTGKPRLPGIGSIFSPALATPRTDDSWGCTPFLAAPPTFTGATASTITPLQSPNMSPVSLPGIRMLKIAPAPEAVASGPAAPAADLTGGGPNPRTQNSIPNTPSNGMASLGYFSYGIAPPYQQCVLAHQPQKLPPSCSPHGGTPRVESSTRPFPTYVQIPFQAKQPSPCSYPHTQHWGLGIYDGRNTQNPAVHSQPNQSQPRLQLPPSPNFQAQTHRRSLPVNGTPESKSVFGGISSGPTNGTPNGQLSVSPGGQSSGPPSISPQCQGSRSYGSSPSGTDIRANISTNNNGNNNANGSENIGSRYHSFKASVLSAAKDIKRRTKTGCITCRKRRIKCGEEQPTCANCEKSKRICLGYDPIFRNAGEKRRKHSRAQSLGTGLSTGISGLNSGHNGNGNGRLSTRMYGSVGSDPCQTHACSVYSGTKFDNSSAITLRGDEASSSDNGKAYNGDRTVYNSHSNHSSMSLVASPNGYEGQDYKDETTPVASPKHDDKGKAPSQRMEISSLLDAAAALEDEKRIPSRLVSGNDGVSEPHADGSGLSNQSDFGPETTWQKVCEFYSVQLAPSLDHMLDTGRFHECYNVDMQTRSPTRASGSSRPAKRRRSEDNWAALEAIRQLVAYLVPSSQLDGLAVINDHGTRLEKLSVTPEYKLIRLVMQLVSSDRYTQYLPVHENDYGIFDKVQTLHVFIHGVGEPLPRPNGATEYNELSELQVQNLTRDLISSYTQGSIPATKTWDLMQHFARCARGGAPRLNVELVEQLCFTFAQRPATAAAGSKSESHQDLRVLILLGLLFVINGYLYVVGGGAHALNSNAGPHIRIILKEMSLERQLSAFSKRLVDLALG